MFKTQPQHDFQYKSSKYLNGTFDNCYTMKDFMKNINKMAKEWEKQEGYDPDKFKGDAFEFFIELLLMLHPNDSRVGIYDYAPNNRASDNGVDGLAKNFKREEAAIQIKYRTRTDKALSSNENNLANLVSSAMTDFDIIMDREDHKNYRHFIFTTADGLHWYTDNEVFKKRVKCFGLKQLKKLVDNNKPFWDSCREIIQQITDKRNAS
jgi:hypothetical protein